MGGTLDPGGITLAQNPDNQRKPDLVIETGSKQGLYRVHNGAELGHPDMTLVQFPHRCIITEMWQALRPDVRMEILGHIEKPTLGFVFYLDTLVTNPPEFDMFLEQLRQACVVIDFEVKTTVAVGIVARPVTFSSK